MATGGITPADAKLSSLFQRLSLESADSSLKVKYHIHKSASKLTATIMWTYQSSEQVDIWKVRVRNLTWEQNDYDYDKKVFKCDGGTNKFKLPLWFRPGNRYEVKLYGQSRCGARCTVVCKRSVEFRAGELLSVDDVIRLRKAAELFNARPSRYGVACCKHLYRNKPKEYFDSLFSEQNGIMETYLKDGSGDQRSPINGEIYGLFFLANVNRHGEPFPTSPFGDTRVLVDMEEILRLTPNMFFADFHCMLYKQEIHHVTIVLTKSGSRADQFCNDCLPKLDITNNPFLYRENYGSLMVSSAVFVDVFVTENLDLNDMIIDREVAEMKYHIPTRGSGKTSQGGKMGVKSSECEHCDIFSERPMAENSKNYEEF